MRSCDVAIVGAGPYGLSAAAHLRTIKGLEVRVFGEPMSFWDRNMPKGMLLRSNWTATQIANPDNSLTLEAFRNACGNHLSAPVPLDRFVQYGLWYQRRAVPDLDQRKVNRVEPAGRGFRLTVAGDEPLHSARVIIAAGINSFAWRPPEFERLSPDLVSHTSEHRDLSTFAGKRVLVVGSGQSALESGALLHEAGAEVEIVGRAQRIHWLQGRLSRTLHHKLGKMTNRLLYAPTDVGPAGLSQLVARPELFKRLPRSMQDKLRKRSVRPAGARWLVNRLREVSIHLDNRVVSLKPVGERVKATLNNRRESEFDHVLLGTGYRVDVSKYDFFAPEITHAIRRVNGYPCLKADFETSVPGLHMIGAPAVWSFGPLLQFVSGTHYASQTLTRSIASQIGERNKVQ